MTTRVQPLETRREAENGIPIFWGCIFGWLHQVYWFDIEHIQLLDIFPSLHVSFPLYLSVCLSLSFILPYSRITRHRQDLKLLCWELFSKVGKVIKSKTMSVFQAKVEKRWINIYIKRKTLHLEFETETMHEKKLLTILKRKNEICSNGNTHKHTHTTWVWGETTCNARHELSTPTLIPTNKTRKKKKPRSTKNFTIAYLVHSLRHNIHTDEMAQRKVFTVQFYRAHTTFQTIRSWMLAISVALQSPMPQLFSFSWKHYDFCFIVSFCLLVGWLVGFSLCVKHRCLYVTDTIKARQWIEQALGTCRTLNGVTNQALVACLLYETK